ncbi:hypothetical protein ACWCRF_19950 [Streptomyces sp. NPDC002405]|uniref:hypothetical protein n=1 Tax=Streptomyces sp. NPDC057596 TaxID=3346178 RepID=UPI0036BB46D7
MRRIPGRLARRGRSSRPGGAAVPHPFCPGSAVRGDIADLALLLASGVSADVTGQVMVSDGGWTADGFGITATAAGR